MSDQLLYDDMRWMGRQARAPKLRTMRQFAEDEIVVHTGPCKGRFRVRNQPFMGLWLTAVDSGLWRLFNTTGPRQAGKTLLTSIIPLMYHLFEIGETVIFAVPDLDIADDKYRENLLPAIAATRYVELLPTTGEGSRHGKVKNAIVFRNGATLKFMSGGASGISSDRGRQGYTARVVVVTEKSAFGCGGEASVETNKLDQIRACTNSFGDKARFYEESTLTTELDPTYIDLKQGTDSQIQAPCPHCASFVAPEREHLSGWQEAQSEKEAKANAFFCCPACGEKLDESQRRTMNERAVLVHRGQEVINGCVAGELPPTDTLGFRFSAFQNNFRTAGDVAVDEWKASRAPDEEDAERKMCQFVWALPYQTKVEKITPLTREGIIHRLAKTPKGIVPAETQFFTIGIDWGQTFRTAWWVAIAWLPDGSSVVVDYGHIDVQSDTLGVEAALALAERDFRERCELGWTFEGHGYVRQPDAVLEDIGWKDTIIYAGMRAANANEATRGRYFPSKGFGSNQYAGQNYHAPKKTGATVLLIGEDYHVSAMPAHRVHLVEFNADVWKLFAQTRLSCQLDEPGAMRLHAAMPSEHKRFASHILAEQVHVEFVPDKGEVRKFKKKGPNHLLDAVVNACLAGHFVGVRVVEPDRNQEPVVRKQEPVASPAVQTPDGRPYSILER